MVKLLSHLIKVQYSYNIVSVEKDVRHLRCSQFRLLREKIG